MTPTPGGGAIPDVVPVPPPPFASPFLPPPEEIIPPFLSPVGGFGGGGFGGVGGRGGLFGGGLPGSGIETSWLCPPGQVGEVPGVSAGPPVTPPGGAAMPPGVLVPAGPGVTPGAPQESIPEPAMGAFLLAAALGLFGTMRRKLAHEV